jgi:hypothetical protein
MFDEDSRSEPFRPLGPGMRPIAELPPGSMGTIFCVNDRGGSTRIAIVARDKVRTFRDCNGLPVDAVEWRDATDEERVGFEGYVAASEVTP